MRSLRKRALLAVILLGCFQFAPAQSRSTPDPLPPAPSPAASPASAPLLLPKTTGLIPPYASKSTDAPAPQPANHEDWCTASSASGTQYRTSKPATPEQQRATDLYVRLLMQRIYQNWRIPRAAHDPWIKGAQLRVRFAVAPDGSVVDPSVTVSSGRVDYDGRALESVKKASPFEPPPTHGDGPLKMCVRFYYNMEPPPADPFAKKPAGQ